MPVEGVIRSQGGVVAGVDGNCTAVHGASAEAAVYWVVDAFTGNSVAAAAGVAVAADSTFSRIANGDHSLRDKELFDSAFVAVQRAIRELEGPEFGGAGVTMAAISFQREHLSYAHIGDCRILCTDNASLAKLTDDHSMGRVRREGTAWLTHDELHAAGDGLKSQSSEYDDVLLRAILRDTWISSSVNYEYGEIGLNPTDRFLLSTRGVHRQLTEEQLCSIAGSAEDSLEAAVSRITEELACHQHLTSSSRHAGLPAPHAGAVLLVQRVGG